MSSTAAWFRASKARPSARLPSPITATTWRSFPSNRRPRAMPRATEMDVPAWDASIGSCSLSARERKRFSPSYELSVGNSAARPVTILCV